MDYKKTRDNAAIYLLLFVGCALLYFWITPQQVPINAKMTDSGFTPQTFPNHLTVIIAAASLIGFVSSAMQCKKIAGKDAHTGSPGAPRKRKFMAVFAPYAVFALVLVYAVLFRVTGFIWSTAVIAPAMLILLGARKWYYYPITYAFAAIMYGIFRFVLLVPLS